MEIKVKQNVFSFLRSTYRILADGQKRYVAKASVIHTPFVPELLVFDLNDNELLRITKAEAFFWQYDFQYPNGERFELRAVDNLKFASSFVIKSDHYNVLGHTNGKFSFFKNDKQIAWFEREKGGDYYTIIANNNSNPLILSAIVLSFDLHLHPGNDFSSDSRNIGWKLKPFDEKWTPS